MKMAVINILLFVFIIGFVGYLYFKWKFSYWQRKGVPYLKPTIPFGTSGNPFKAQLHPGLAFQVPYREFKTRGNKHGGLYTIINPLYMIVHPEYIKNILSKDFQYFTDRGTYYNDKDDPMSAHLFNLPGPEWTKARTKMTPSFTSGKIKMMFKIVEECGNQLKIAVDKLSINREPVDIKAVLECYSTDVIASCAFGLEFNSFTDPNNDFRRNCLKFLATTKFNTLKIIFATFYPNIAKFLKIRLVSSDIRHYFLNLIQTTISYRDKNNITRPDFLNLLMEVRKTKENQSGLTVMEIAAEAFVIFIAGFETSSTTISFCIYELSCNRDVQDKVRSEILKILEEHDNRICYEAIMKMNYLGQVLDESLRKYPPLPAVPRQCVKDYKIPNTDIVIKKGTKVVIPCYAIHHDADLHPDPEKFDPERFSAENKTKVAPFTYLPFGLGPRNCIGLRFGLLEVKTALVFLLSNFSFSVNEKTKPLEFEHHGLFLRSLHEIWLNVEKIG